MDRNRTEKSITAAPAARNPHAPDPARRRALALLGGAASALTLPGASAAPAGPERPRKRLGVSAACYGFRSRATEPAGDLSPFRDAMDFLEHCHRLGAGCLQVGVGGWQDAFAEKVRERRETLGIALEGQISLPKTETDVPRFEEEVRAAREAGAAIVRTVCLGGRRYESFDSLEAFQAFRERSWKSLTLAEPVVRKAKVALAVENHKDWRVPELLDILRRLGSESVGVCLDTGNSISLLEDPMAVVEALAPFAFTTHFKDMDFRESTDGFLLSEVPLGEGVLDLRHIMETCEKHRPDIQFNLEMITRDPLRIPCLQEGYWPTFPDVAGRELAAMLSRVRRSPQDRELPSVANLSPEAKVRFEEENVKRSFAFARSHFGL